LNTGGTGLVYAPSVFRFGAGPGQRCAVTLDYNADGRPDLLACRLKNKTPVLYRNMGSTFTNAWNNYSAFASLITNTLFLSISPGRKADKSIITSLPCCFHKIVLEVPSTVSFVFAVRLMFFNTKADR